MARNQLRFSPRRAKYAPRQPLKKKADIIPPEDATGTAPSVRIFLDDDRPCPKGWVLVRNVEEFRVALHACSPQSLQAVSLDWDLGFGQPSGHDAAQILVDHLLSDPEAFEMDAIFCHSGSIQEATRMSRTISAALFEDPSLSWISILQELPTAL